jgi:hypothetical protein
VQEERSGSQNQAPDGSGIVRKSALVTVVGGYNDIVRFIDKLQNSQRKCWIDSVRVNVGGSAGKLKCEALLTIYCFERMEMAFYE